MSNIKNMFAKMAANGGGGGDNNAETLPKTKASKKPTIEETYQKKTQLEHILLRPDTYIGSVEKTSEEMWIYDTENKQMVHKKIEYVPGLYKIFDEILVNAADNKQRDKTMNCIKIDINVENNTISIWNNGQGIPVTMHKEENIYVPTMIFGHLLTSSNYNDEEEKVTGGRNGYGAKLCNIFSTKFTVETASKEYKLQFKQTWGSNMTEASDPKVRDFFGEDFTKITFTPDLKKFKMICLDDDIVGLMSRRAYDVAASTRGVKVILNSKQLSVKTFKDYVDLYIKDKEDESGNNLKVIYESPNDRWEVAITLSNSGFRQMSFVNSIATTKGGRHVDYVVDMIVKQLIELLKKKNKGGVNIKPFQVKNHIWIFVNCLIVNPTFDSQTKENMTLQVKNFGSKCNLSDKFMTQVTKSGIIESVLSWAKFKAQTELVKTSGKKRTKLKIPKLEDANKAGEKESLKCTLILTEGDSAKTLAVSGLGVIGRDYYGVFPLKGKLLNVREATHKQILENQEINNLIQIIGLKYKKKYETEDDMKTLRYGKVMIMADQDQDGSHIKGLVINFIHHNWPELLRQNFLEEFITPIVKARKRTECLSFFSLPEFEEWKSNTPNHNTYSIKYYKGLGSSDSKEMREYFTNMARHRIRFRYQGKQDDEHIVLAFSKKHIEHRKEWLTNFMVESRRRKEFNLPEVFLYTKDTKYVTFTDFINLELVLFSNADNMRSIPSVVDGLKPGQRKVLYTCFKRNVKKEIKLIQLGGAISQETAYHHGDTSLYSTIINLAQNFVGSNNINLLLPCGQFGTRVLGGKDSASPRYIATKLSPLARVIFHTSDDPLLKHEFEDNQKVEPYWFIPIIPMVMVNGADGIGTGWMTKIGNYNPREIVQNLRLMLDGEEPINMLPWYKNFKGTIEECNEQRYVVSGEIAITAGGTIEITELPVGTWTQNYKENVLEPLYHGSEKVKPIISNYNNYSTEATVRYVITFLPGQLENTEKEGFHKVFKLQSVFSTNSMCAFDEFGCMTRYNSIMDILKNFYKVRLSMYQKRKDYIEGILEAEAKLITNQARFIMEKCSREIVVENKKRKVIIDELRKRGYDPDPIKEWKQRVKAEEDDEIQPDEDVDENQEDEEENRPKKKNEIEESELSDVKKFDYLLGMSLWMLTDEKKNELLRQKDVKMAALEAMKKKTKSDLWKEDLDEFLIKLNEVEAKEKSEEEGETKKQVKKVGKKRVETMPSPAGRRVAPVIGDDLKKKIQTAIKSKEGKDKRGLVKKESITDNDEKDEFDLMVASKKTIKDKFGTPEEIEKKVKAKKQTADGFKQTKLNFKKANGSPKKHGKKNTSDDELSDLNVDQSPSPVKERVLSRRTATKTIKYSISDEDDKDISSDDDLRENIAVKEHSTPKKKIVVSSDSENEFPQKTSVHETSEELFDSLVGRKANDDDSGQKKRKSDVFNSDSDDFHDVMVVKAKTAKNKKAKSNESDEKKPSGSDDLFSDDDVLKGKINKKKKKKTDSGGSGEKKQRKPKTKKLDSDDESYNDNKKTKSKKKKKDSDDEDFDILSRKPKGKKTKHFEDDSFSDDSDKEASPLPKPRSGRAKQTKYVFSDEDSD